MKTQEFIEKAIEGGWEYSGYVDHSDKTQVSDGQMIVEHGRVWHAGSVREIKSILLDPKAWEAVGKVDGQGVFCIECDNYVPVFGECECDDVEPVPQEWHIYKMHEMIDALIAGQSLEEYIKTL